MIASSSVMKINSLPRKHFPIWYAIMIFTQLSTNTNKINAIRPIVIYHIKQRIT